MRWVYALAVGLMLAAPAAIAQTEAPAPPPSQTAPIASQLAGTIVHVEIRERLSSMGSRRGETFQFRLTAPVSLNGAEIIPTGAVGVGEIVEAKPGSCNDGKPGELIVSGQYVEHAGERIPVRWNVTLGGYPNTTLLARAAGACGENLQIEAGRTATGFIGADVDAPEGFGVAAYPPPEGINAPEPGMGQIVFLRLNRNTAAPYTYNVREGEAEIARLPNGTYYVVQVQPGRHEYGISGPSLFGGINETLRIDVLPGATYYVQHGVYHLRASPANEFAEGNLRPSQSQPRSSEQRR